jgi:hypothetical protein
LSDNDDDDDDGNDGNDGPGFQVQGGPIRIWMCPGPVAIIGDGHGTLPSNRSGISENCG